jgi:hypothetical protein
MPPKTMSQRNKILFAETRLRLRRFLVGVVLPLAGSCSLLIRPD